MILYYITADILIPFYYQLSKYLEGAGYSSCFVSFLPRESLLLKKNNVEVFPQNVHAIKNYKIIEGLLSPEEIDDLLRFFLIKVGGERKYWEDRLLRAASYLQDLLDANSFNAVIIWNGEDFIGKALKILAKRKSVKVIFAENGYFPRTLQFDRGGVNINSSIAKLTFAEICRSIPSESKESHPSQNEFKLADIRPLGWQEYLRCFVVRKLNLKYYQYFPEHRGNSWFTLQWLKYQRSLIPLDQHELPEKYIFIPFQVHDDTQILLNSRFFKNMEDFFEFAYKTIKRNFGDEFKIVVKEHPEDLGRYSYASLREKYSDVIWLRKYNIDTLLEKAAYVFVINSSVGLQAIQKLRPTIIFGESFYTRDELAYPVYDLQQIDQVISQAKAGLTIEMKENITKFIQYLSAHFFVSASWKDITERGVGNAGNRIQELIKG